jgi:S1-C subfamily serine protease
VRWDWQVVEGKPCYAITAVTRGSGAEKAGLRPGDRIMSVDSREVKNDALLPAAVLRDESEVLLTIGRGAEELKDIHVPLAGQAVKLGLSWREDSAAPGAVFITRVVPYSPAARAGLRVLDRIYSVRGETFASQEALLERVTALMADEQTPIHFEVETAGRIHPIDVDLKLPTGPSADASL